MKERIFKERGKEFLLALDAIAELYLQLHRQPRSAWSHEIDVRPWFEKFWALRNRGSRYDRNLCTIDRCSDETVTVTKLIFELGIRLTQMR
jgi:hypothetical protein